MASAKGESTQACSAGEEEVARVINSDCAASPGASARKHRPEAPTLRTFEVGTHEGFPSLKVLLWVGTKAAFEAAAAVQTSCLDPIRLPAASTVDKHLTHDLGGYTRIEQGTIVATCLPEEESFPLRHQAVFGLLDPPAQAIDGADDAKVDNGQGAVQAGGMLDWHRVRRDVLGAEGATGVGEDGRVPLMGLSPMPGDAAGQSASYGTFTAGVVIAQGLVEVAANNQVGTDADDEGQEQRCAAFANLTALVADPMHRVHADVHNASHCAMLASAARAAAEPGLTLGSVKSWSATQLDLIVKPALPLRPRAMEVFSGWVKAVHDDTVLPSVQASVPWRHSSTALDRHHQGAVVSSLGLFFMLPLAEPALFIMQRAFAYVIIQPRSTPRNRTAREEQRSSLIVSVSADARLLISSCRAHVRCLVCASGVQRLPRLVPRLSGALGSEGKAEAWYDWHSWTLHCFLQASSRWNQGDCVPSNVRSLSTQHAERVQINLGVQLLSLGQRLTLVDAKDRGCGDGTEELREGSAAPCLLISGRARGSYALSAGDGVEGMSQQSIATLASAVNAWSRRQPTVEPDSEVDAKGVRRTSGRVGQGGVAGKRAKGSTATRGREAKRLRLGLTPHQLLMLTYDAPTAEDYACLTVSDLAPGRHAVQSIIDQRIASLEAQQTQGAELWVLSDSLQLTHSAPSCAAPWLSRAERVGTLFQAERLGVAAALRCRIASLIEAFAFYQELKGYCVRLAHRAIQGREALLSEPGVDCSMADLVEWIAANLVKPSKADRGSTSLTIETSAGMGGAQSSAVPQELVEKLLVQLSPGGRQEHESLRRGTRILQTEAWLRHVPGSGMMGRRTKAAAIQLPLFDVLLQLWGAPLVEVMGSEHGERDPSLLCRTLWPSAVRRMEMRIDIMERFYEAQGRSHRALSLPGVCTLVGKPFWFFEVAYGTAFFDPSKGYRMPKEWLEVVMKGIEWTQDCASLQRLFELTTQADGND